MKNKLNDVITLTGKSNFTYLIILSCMLIFLSFLEFIGIGFIPIFLSVILDPNLLSEKIKIPEVVSFINNHQKSELILYSSFFLIIIFVIKNLFYILIVYFQGLITKRIKLYLVLKVYKKYLNLSYLKLIGKNSAVMIRSLTMDCGNTSIFLLNIINLIRETAIFFAILLLLFIASPIISLIMITFFGLISLIYFLKTHKKIFHQGLSLQFLASEKIKIINNTIGCIKEIKIFKLEKFLEKIFLNNSNKYEKFAFRNYFIKLVPRVILEIGAVTGIISLVVVYVFLEKNLMTLLPLLSLVVVSIIRIVPGLNLIQNSLSTLKTILPSYNHILGELKTDDKDIVNNKKLIKFNNEIVLDNINFGYNPQTKLVLKGISLKIQKSEKIGIIGKSGAGKTTLVGILLGLINPLSGDMYVDKKKINFSEYEWDNVVGYVPQEIFLLEDSIKNNITFGIEDNNIDMNFLEEVCKKSQIYDFIISLTDKFETIVGEKGYNLSAGQKQRLGIARALYRRPSLLILDESTSSLDGETEKLFIEDVFDASNDKSIVFISHRLSALKKCDKIFDLNQIKFLSEQNEK